MPFEDYVVSGPRPLAEYGILDHDARKAKENGSRRPVDLYDDEDEDDYKPTSRPVRTPQPLKAVPGTQAAAKGTGRPPFVKYFDHLAGKGLSLLAKNIYGYLENLDRGPGNVIRPKQNTIADYYETDRWAVAKALKELEREKLITRQRLAYGKSTHYTVL